MGARENSYVTEVEGGSGKLAPTWCPFPLKFEGGAGLVAGTVI